MPYFVKEYVAGVPVTAYCVEFGVAKVLSQRLTNTRYTRVVARLAHLLAAGVITAKKALLSF
jgi:hypothetical protein